MPNYSSNAQFSGQLRKQSEAGAKILLLEYKKKKKNSPQISRSRSGPQIPLLLLCVPTACQQINTLKLKLSSFFFFFTLQGPKHTCRLGGGGCTQTR